LTKQSVTDSIIEYKNQNPNLVIEYDKPKVTSPEPISNPNSSQLDKLLLDSLSDTRNRADALLESYRVRIAGLEGKVQGSEQECMDKHSKSLRKTKRITSKLKRLTSISKTMFTEKQV